MNNFYEIVSVRKTSSCTTCFTFEYTLPVNLTQGVEKYLVAFGKLSYNLDKCKIVRIDNSELSISNARIGSPKFKVKFKKNRDALKELFEIHIAAFLEEELNSIITMS